MTILNRTSILFIFLCTGIVFSAEPVYEIIGLEGTAKVQRSQKRAWEKISVGMKLADNELVESFFQTKLMLRFGSKNVVILGSNSKALLNIAEKELAGKKVLEASLSLFSGGIFAKSISESRVSIFTANAVCEMDSGSVSAVTEAKTGETGFQVLGGSISARNIAQQKGTELSAGLTTMILPGKEPTASLYITNRHVAVLKHFFGDDHISQEMDASGIKPTDDRALGSRKALSQSQGPITHQAAADEGIYKVLFSVNKIYGSIIDDRERYSSRYKSIVYPSGADFNSGFVDIGSQLAWASSGVHSRYFLMPQVMLGPVEAAFQLSIVKNYQDETFGGFTSLAGWLDKVHHLTITGWSDSTYLRAGRISSVTLGDGLLVNEFTNVNQYLIVQPMGLVGGFRMRNVFSAKGFLGDIMNPGLGGIYLKLEPSLYLFGFGFHFDLDQYSEPQPPEHYRFADARRPDSLVSVSGEDIHDVKAYEVCFAAELANTHDFSMKLSFEFAQKLQNGSDGFVTRMPFIQVDWSKSAAGIGLIIESGRLISGQFGYTYMANRSRIIGDSTLITPNSVLSKKRTARGVAAYYRTNPFYGGAIDLGCKLDFSSRKTMLARQSAQPDSAMDIPGDLSYNVRLSINDSLFPLIHYSGIYLRQSHSALYPRLGKPMRSWNFEAGFDFLSTPLLFNSALDAGIKMYYLNLGAQTDRVDPADRIIELRFGLKWGFG